MYLIPGKQYQKVLAQVLSFSMDNARKILGP